MGYSWYSLKTQYVKHFYWAKKIFLDDDIEQVSEEDFLNPAKELVPDKSEIDFSRLDLRVGKIVDARIHPVIPDVLYLLLVNIGEPWGRPVVSNSCRFSHDNVDIFSVTFSKLIKINHQPLSICKVWSTKTSVGIKCPQS